MTTATPGALLVGEVRVFGADTSDRRVVPAVAEPPDKCVGCFRRDLALEGRELSSRKLARVPGALTCALDNCCQFRFQMKLRRHWPTSVLAQMIPRRTMPAREQPMRGEHKAARVPWQGAPGGADSTHYPTHYHPATRQI